MIDLSGYEGVHVLRATATVDGKDSWCIIVVNADKRFCTDGRPHFVAIGDGRITWAEADGKIGWDGLEIHSIIGEMVLPGSLEAPAEPCNCDLPPATCTISSECSETNPVVKELISAMTRQFEMVVGVLEKFAQAE